MFIECITKINDKIAKANNQLLLVKLYLTLITFPNFRDIGIQTRASSECTNNQSALKSSNFAFRINSLDVITIVHVLV